MIATLTMSRGDRPQFLEFCKEQIARQTLKPDKAYFITYPAKGNEFDLTQRFRIGYEMAKADGVDRLYVIEDDDQYSEDHIQRMENEIGDADFIGYNSTLYYNLRNRSWMHQTHPGRSSLFCTGFKVSALSDFIWPPDHYLWLDVRLWEFARDRRKNKVLLETPSCTGIKHSVGLTAGKAHKQILPNRDMDLSFLKSRVSDWHFDFYSKLKL